MFNLVFYYAYQVEQLQFLKLELNVLASLFRKIFIYIFKANLTIKMALGFYLYYNTCWNLLPVNSNNNELAIVLLNASIKSSNYPTSTSYALIQKPAPDVFFALSSIFITGIYIDKDI